MRKKKKPLRKIIFLSAVFITALIVYFLRSYRSMERSTTVYSMMEKPTLPLVYVERDGNEVNPMHGFLQDMGNREAEDSITVLPSDRQLHLNIQEYGKMVVSLSYEVRSLDLSELVENGKITEFDRQESGTKAVVPIQNIIAEDKPYLLKLTLDTGEQTINYYTRILRVQDDHFTEMVNFAEDFTQRTFSKSDAKAIAAYLESNDNADNSTFGRVTIHSSFSQITWGDTGMQQLGDLTVTVKQMEGIMGEVEVSYLSECTDNSGSTRRFVNEDHFVLRQDSMRMYLMNFERSTREIFDRASTRFAGKEMRVGVGVEGDFETVKSTSGQFTALSSGHSLVRYDTNQKTCKEVFDYSEAEPDFRSDLTENGIRILKTENNGDIDFLVYGYVNRGIHEGYNGIVFYTYDNSEDTLIENFFIPLQENYEFLKRDVEKISYLNSKGMLYFYYNGAVYGIDTRSFEIMTVVSGFSDWEIYGSESGRYAAWQDAEESDCFHSDKITLMDLETEETQDYSVEGRNIRLFGYMGEDLAAGLSADGQDDTATANSERPVSEIQILGPDLTIKTSYQREQLYFANVENLKSRLHFEEFQRSGESYAKVGEDSIISNRSRQEGSEQLIEKNDSVLEKIYSISIPDIGSGTVNESEPAHLSLEKTSTIDVPEQETENKEPEFLAYSLGHLKTVARTMNEAYTSINDDFGLVLDENRETIWNRTNKPSAAKVSELPNDFTEVTAALPTQSTIEETDHYILVNATGLSVNAVLYYVGQGLPVIAYEDSSNYQLISGYDIFNVNLRNADFSGDTAVIGKEDSEQYFGSRGLRFVAVIER